MERDERGSRARISSDRIAAAIRDYVQNPDDAVKDIAARHHISPSMLSTFARREGVLRTPKRNAAYVNASPRPSASSSGACAEPGTGASIRTSQDKTTRV